ncbi:hypothetical protein [Oceanibaculum nanhaiense]|uniref:hypothetical protein n=1 Tax=Oceanibaculum nanhaiense TaxID=1909734 RepID=UPI003F7156B3
MAVTALLPKCIDDLPVSVLEFFDTFLRSVFIGAIRKNILDTIDSRRNGIVVYDIKKTAPWERDMPSNIDEVNDYSETLNDNGILLFLEEKNAFPSYINKEDSVIGRNRGKQKNILLSLSKTNILEFSKSIDIFLDHILVCPEEFYSWFRKEYKKVPVPLKEFINKHYDDNYVTLMEQLERILRDNGARKIQTNSTGEKERFRDIFVISFHSMGDEKKYLHNTELSKMVWKNFLPKFRESSLRVEIAEWKTR